METVVVVTLVAAVDGVDVAGSIVGDGCAGTVEGGG